MPSERESKPSMQKLLYVPIVKTGVLAVLLAPVGSAQAQTRGCHVESFQGMLPDARITSVRSLAEPVRHCKVEGVIELAEEIFHLPVRLGVPKGVSGLTEVVCSPTNATGVGLLLFGHQQMRDAGEESAPRRGFGSMLERMRSWFQGNF